MGTWRIEINDDNDAFWQALERSPTGPYDEIARILREIVEQFERHDPPDVDYVAWPLRDCNGNTCGHITYDDGDSDYDDD